jgi:hypothetical protein
MVKVLEHLLGEGADVHLPAVYLQFLHQGVRTRAGRFGRRKTGHGDRYDVGSRTVHEIKGADGDEEGLSGVKAAGDADDRLADPRALKAPAQSLNLNAAGLEAVQIQSFRIIGYIGETRDAANRRKRPLEGWIEME